MPRHHLLAALPLTVALALGCQAPSSLVVDLRTDLVPGIEFAFVRTVVEGPGLADELTVPANADASYGEGVRVAEVPHVEARHVTVTTYLLDRLGEEVLTRRLMAQLDESLAVTMVITRDCLALSCPGATDDPGATECFAGRCVQPDCGSPGAPACPAPECEIDADCAASAACAQPTCVLGACLAAPDPLACAEGELCHPDTGCEPLPAPPECGRCGDLDGDGRVTVSDMTMISLLAVGSPVDAPCAADGDILGGDGPTRRDSVALGYHIFGPSDGTGICQPCTRACGDVNGDGALDAADVTSMGGIVSLGGRMDACATWAADVDGDFEHTAADVTLLEAAIDAGAPIETCVE